MRNVWHIYRRELATYFTTPIAYVVMTLFILLANIFFFVRIQQFQMYYTEVFQQQAMMGGAPDVNLNATEIVVAFMFFQMSVVLLFLVPMLTMRLFSEEHQLGTLELLFSCPVRVLEVILGKFLAALSVCVVLLALTLIYPIFLAFQTTLELGVVFTGYVGLVLLASAFVAIGLFFSSLTENQIVAGALTFATLLFLWLLAALVQTNSVAGGLGEFLSKASIILRYENFAKGVVNLGDGIYYLTVAAFGLYLTRNVLNAKTH